MAPRTRARFSSMWGLLGRRRADARLRRANEILPQRQGSYPQQGLQLSAGSNFWNSRRRRGSTTVNARNPPQRRRSGVHFSRIVPPSTEDLRVPTQEIPRVVHSKLNIKRPSIGSQILKSGFAHASHARNWQDNIFIQPLLIAGQERRAARVRIAQHLSRRDGRRRDLWSQEHLVLTRSAVGGSPAKQKRSELVVGWRVSSVSRVRQLLWHLRFCSVCKHLEVCVARVHVPLAPDEDELIDLRICEA